MSKTSVVDCVLEGLWADLVSGAGSITSLRTPPVPVACLSCTAPVPVAAMLPALWGFGQGACSFCAYFGTPLLLHLLLLGSAAFVTSQCRTRGWHWACWAIPVQQPCSTPAFAAPTALGSAPRRRRRVGREIILHEIKLHFRFVVNSAAWDCLFWETLMCFPSSAAVRSLALQQEIVTDRQYCDMIQLNAKL